MPVNKFENQNLESALANALENLIHQNVTLENLQLQFDMQSDDDESEFLEYLQEPRDVYLHALSKGFSKSKGKGKIRSLTLKEFVSSDHHTLAALLQCEGMPKQVSLERIRFLTTAAEAASTEAIHIPYDLPTNQNQNQSGNNHHAAVIEDLMIKDCVWSKWWSKLLALSIAPGSKMKHMSVVPLIWFEGRIIMDLRPFCEALKTNNTLSKLSCHVETLMDKEQISSLIHALKHHNTSVEHVLGIERGMMRNSKYERTKMSLDVSFYATLNRFGREKARNSATNIGEFVTLLSAINTSSVDSSDGSLEWPYDRELLNDDDSIISFLGVEKSGEYDSVLSEREDSKYFDLSLSVLYGLLLECPGLWSGNNPVQRKRKRKHGHKQVKCSSNLGYSYLTI